MGLGPKANKIEDSKMVLASSSVHVVCPHPQGEFQLPPACPVDSPRPVDGYEPGSFQVTVLALGLRIWDILCMPSKSGVSISHSPLGLLKVSPTGLQSQTF